VKNVYRLTIPTKLHCGNKKFAIRFCFVVHAASRHFWLVQCFQKIVGHQYWKMINCCLLKIYLLRPFSDPVFVIVLYTRSNWLVPHASLTNFYSLNVFILQIRNGRKRTELLQQQQLIYRFTLTYKCSDTMPIEN
jgi:hypothetical protein